MPQIGLPYESEDFPPGGSVANGADILPFTWDDLLWAAVTVGRPNRQYVFKNGAPSVYEAIFRWSLIRMTLEQAGPSARRLYRTTAAKTLDPSEKGAVNYFLGLAITKLFTSKLLRAPWMMHLDVFRPQLNPVLGGRSRPDLVGQVRGNQGWIAVECKGRASPPDVTAKEKAKQQALRLMSVNGSKPILHLGAFSYFKGDALRFLWRDPNGDEHIKGGFGLEAERDVWRYYYRPALQVIESRRPRERSGNEIIVDVEEADLQLGIQADVFGLLEGEHWDKARDVADEIAEGRDGERFQPDGLRVIAGSSWFRPQEEF